MKILHAVLVGCLVIPSFHSAQGSASSRIKDKQDAKRDRIDAIKARARRPTPTPTATAYNQSLTVQGKKDSLAEKLYHLMKDQYDGRNDHGVTNLDGTLSLAQSTYDKVECTQVLPVTADFYRCRMVGTMRSGSPEYLAGRSYQNVTLSSGLLFTSAAGKLFRLIYNASPSSVSAHDPKTDYFLVKIAELGDTKSPNALTCELEGVPAPVALDVRKVQCSYRGIERPTRYYP